MSASGLSPEAIEAKRLADEAEDARKAESEEDRKKRLDSEKDAIDKYLEEKRKKAAEVASGDIGAEIESTEGAEETASTINTAINAMRASADPKIQEIAITPVADWPIGEDADGEPRTPEQIAFAKKFEEEVKKAKEEKLKVDITSPPTTPADPNKAADPNKNNKKAPSMTTNAKEKAKDPHAGGPEESAGYNAKGMFDKFFGYVEDFLGSWVMQFVYYAIAKVVISAWSVVSGITQNIIGTVAAGLGWKVWGGDIAKRGTTLDGTVTYFGNIAQFLLSAFTLNPDGMKAASIAARNSFNNSIFAKAQNLFGPLVSKGLATIEIGLGGMVANTLMGNFRGAWNSFSGIFYAKETSERQPGLWQLLGATALDPFGHLPGTSLLGGTIVHAHGVEMLIAGEQETTDNKRTRIRGLIEYLDPSFQNNLVYYYDRVSRRGVLNENDPSGAVTKDMFGHAITYPNTNRIVDGFKLLGNALASPFTYPFGLDNPFQTSYDEHAKKYDITAKNKGKGNARVVVLEEGEDEVEDEDKKSATLTAEEEVAGPPAPVTVSAEESNPSVTPPKPTAVSARVAAKPSPQFFSAQPSTSPTTRISVSYGQELSQQLPQRKTIASASQSPAEAKGYFSTFRGYTTIPLYNMVRYVGGGLFAAAQQQKPTLGTVGVVETGGGPSPDPVAPTTPTVSARVGGG